MSDITFAMKRSICQFEACSKVPTPTSTPATSFMAWFFWCAPWWLLCWVQAWQRRDAVRSASPVHSGPCSAPSNSACDESARSTQVGTLA